MRQFHKGQQLIALCDQKTRSAQQALSRSIRHKQYLLEEIQQRKNELQTLENAIIAQHLHDITATKTEIYTQRRQQTILLYQRQQFRLEHTMLLENLRDVEKEIILCQRQLAYLKRREIKFTQWTQSAKKEWLQQREIANEHELEEAIPWRFQFT